jgi:uncharacterized protein (DUF488 family)
MRHPFFTIGHSTRPIASFIELLNEAEVGLVADVRTVPRSRTNPQYNTDVLPRSLVGSQIGYEHIAALGGLRGRTHDVPPQANAFWENQSFHNYADYAMGEDFRAGLTRLRELGQTRRCAIMCAEAVWWRCHRRIIADYLMAAGEAVFHILASHHIEKAKMTDAAVANSAGILSYPNPACAADDRTKMRARSARQIARQSPKERVSSLRARQPKTR